MLDDLCDRPNRYGCCSPLAGPGGAPVLHLCAVNWSLRLSWESATLFMALRGTLNSRLHKVQTPTAGIVPNHLATLRLRFATIRSKLLQTISNQKKRAIPDIL